MPAYSEYGYVGSAKGRGTLPMIIDTDLGNDIDDALALILAHALERNGECELRGVMVNKDNPYSPALVDVINTFNGRGDIPIGMVREGKTPEDGLFLKPIVEARDGDCLKYPRTFLNYPVSAVTLYRRLLSEAQDNSLVIVSIGFFTNLAALLETGPDKFSELNGVELVARKVKMLSIMAGDFREEALTRQSEEYAEFNVRYDIEAAQKVCRDWPGTIIFSGLEVGLGILYPSESISNDFDWCENHPVVDGYRLYDKMPYDRPCWDLTSILYPVRMEAGYFDLSERGRVSVSDIGVTSFSTDIQGSHQYLINIPEKIPVIQGVMRSLCSHSPESVDNVRPVILK